MRTSPINNNKKHCQINSHIINFDLIASNLGPTVRWSPSTELERFRVKVDSNIIMKKLYLQSY